MNHIRLYDLFRRELHLSDDKAAEFVVAVNDISGMTFDTNKDQLATKNDIHSLKNDIHLLELSLRKEIQQSKEDTYKAIFLAGFVQFIAILGSVLAIIKFMK
jgi:hypothetical protein